MKNIIKKVICGLFCLGLIIFTNIENVKAVVINSQNNYSLAASKSREDCVVYSTCDACYAAGSRVEPQRIRNFEFDFTNMDAFKMQYCIWSDSCYCIYPKFAYDIYYNIKFSDLYFKHIGATEVKLKAEGATYVQSEWTPVINFDGKDYHSEIISCDIMLPEETCSVCGKTLLTNANAGGFEIYDYRGVCTDFPSATVEDGGTLTLCPSFNAYTKRVEYKIRYEGETAFSPLSSGIQPNGMQVTINGDNTIVLSNVNKSKGSYFEILPVTYDRSNQLPYNFNENNNSHIARINITQSSVQNSGQNSSESNNDDSNPIVTPSVANVPANPEPAPGQSFASGTTSSSGSESDADKTSSSRETDKGSAGNAIVKQNETYNGESKTVNVPMEVKTSADIQTGVQAGKTGTVGKNSNINKATNVSDEKKKTLFESIKDNSSEYVTTQERIDKENSIRKADDDKKEIDFNEVDSEEETDIDESLLEESKNSNYTPKINYDSTFILTLLSIIFAFVLLLIILSLFFVVIIYAEKNVKNIVTGEDEKKLLPVAVRLVTRKQKMWCLNVNDLLNEYGIIYAHMGPVFVYLFEDEFMRILSKVKGDEKREIAKEEIKREVIIGKGKARYR